MYLLQYVPLNDIKLNYVILDFFLQKKKLMCVHLYFSHFYSQLGRIQPKNQGYFLQQIMRFSSKHICSLSILPSCMKLHDVVKFTDGIRPNFSSILFRVVASFSLSGFGRVRPSKAAAKKNK